MATLFAENVLREFNVALDELEATFNFQKDAGRLRPRLNDMLDWNNMGGDAKLLANSYLNQKAAELSIMNRGIFLIFSGLFEQLIRGLVQESVASIAVAVPNYDGLKDIVKARNTFHTGQALQTVMQKSEQFEFDYESLCKNIGTCYMGAQDFTLNADVFSIFFSGISPDSIEDVVNRLGISLNWDDLCQDKDLRDLFGKKNTRDTTKATKDYLVWFVKRRNKIAHTGGGDVVVPNTEVEQAFRFFRLIGREFTKTVRKRLPRK